MSKNLNSLGYQAFSNCTNLEEIILPRNLKQVGGEIFNNCYKLRIYCEIESLPSTWSENWNATNRPVTWGY